MRAALFRSLVSFAILATAASAAEAATAGRPLGNHTRVTYPSTVSIEVLGRAMLYSVNFDQVVDDHIAVGAGFGSVSTNRHDTDIDTGETASFIPVYMNYYFTEMAGSPFVTGGVTMILNHAAVKGTDTSTGSLQIPSSTVMPEFGAGYEFRTDTGFLFRVAGYLAAAKSLTPWVGFSFGYAF
jgi:hypothetical protein